MKEPTIVEFKNEIEELQQLFVDLSDGRTLVYVGPAQIRVGDSIKVVDVRVSEPVSLDEIQENMFGGDEEE